MRRPGPDGTLEVWAVTDYPAAAACPDCGMVSARRHDTVLARPRDVRRAGDRVAVWWIKRRWKCDEPSCGRKTFTEWLPQVPPRCRLTVRLREQAGTEVSEHGITPAGAARHAGVSWPVAHAAFAVAARLCRLDPRTAGCLTCSAAAARTIIGVTSAGNKRLMQHAFEHLAQGDGRPFADLMADDFRWVITGKTAWSRVYEGKKTVQEQLLGPLFAQFAGRYRNTAQRVIAEGEWVVVQCRGSAETRRGERYDNEYCFCLPVLRRQAARTH